MRQTDRQTNTNKEGKRRERERERDERERERERKREADTEKRGKKKLTERESFVSFVSLASCVSGHTLYYSMYTCISSLRTRATSRGVDQNSVL